MGMTINSTIDLFEDNFTVVDTHGHWTEVEEQQAIDIAIDTMRKYQQLEDFAKWVAIEVIDEELWTYNHLSFAEIACRKLVQLGIMQESNGEYTYEVLDNGNDD